MDNNNQQTVNMTQQPQMNQQYAQQQYTQQPQMQYAQQPQMNQQYTQQPQMGYQQQMYGQPQMGYNQYGYQQQMPKQPSQVMENIKDVQNQFKNKVSKMGLSTFCLVGIIAAMLLIFGPFMNFASLHFNERLEYEESYYGYYDFDIDIKIKASDGLNMFELSKLSNTVDRVVDELNDEDIMDMDKDDMADDIKDYEEEIVEEAEDETDMDFEGLAKETVGTIMLILRGQLALMVTPWLIILSGVGLLVFTVINNRKMKLICSLIPVGCLLWLMFCASNFFAMMGIGAWAIIAGSVGGIVSYVKEA